MRELVLNHVTLLAPDANTTKGWLGDVARGIASLTHQRVAQNTLRMCRDMTEIWCRPDLSLLDACLSLRPHDRDGYLFLMGLAQKAPITRDLGRDESDRLLACENLHPSGADGEPLLLCAITDGIAVGFPSSPEWDRDQLHVEFEQLLADGEVEHAEEHIDNLTRAVHAEPISRRNGERLRAGATAVEVWERRREAFPGLLFGPEVEGHFKQHARLLPLILRKLGQLDESARNWEEGPAPRWRTDITPESERVRKTPRLSNARLFESERGGRKLFYWHARAADGFRIHFRFESGTRIVEVGYVGPHLPLK